MSVAKNTDREDVKLVDNSYAAKTPINRGQINRAIQDIED